MDNKTDHWLDTVPQNEISIPTLDAPARKAPSANRDIKKFFGENDRLIHDPIYRAQRIKTLRLKAGFGILLLFIALYFAAALMAVLSFDHDSSFLYPAQYLISWGKMSYESWGYLKWIPVLFKGIVSGALIMVTTVIGIIIFAIANTQLRSISHLKGGSEAVHEGTTNDPHSLIQDKIALLRNDDLARKIFTTAIALSLLFWLLSLTTYWMPSSLLSNNALITFLYSALSKYGVIACSVIASLFLMAAYGDCIAGSHRKKLALIGGITHVLTAPVWWFIHTLS